MNHAPALPWLTAALLNVLSGASAQETGSQSETPAKQEKAEAKPADTPASSLLDPKSAEMTKEAPATFKAKFETSKGTFVVLVTRDWSPAGADRFYNLVRNGYYDGVRFFRVIEGFMVQFGISGDPAVNKVWMGASIKDDPVKQSNRRGYVTYAKSNAPNSRTTQVFINFGDNTFLDKQGFSPFGQVVEGMEVVDQLYSGYGEGAPNGQGPSQSLLQSQGNAYLEKGFPKLDLVKKASIVTE